jgi:hypothetical protein
MSATMNDLSRLFLLADKLAKDLRATGTNANDPVLEAAAGLVALVRTAIASRMADEHKAIAERN